MKRTTVEGTGGLNMLTFDSEEKHAKYDQFCTENPSPDMHCRKFIYSLSNEQRNELIEWLDGWQNFHACSWCIREWELWNKRCNDYVNGTP